ncbi:MAG: SDR family NAD(P)-dependent oxidoreductase, partial [Planctomycetaceae bacterium]
ADDQDCRRLIDAALNRHGRLDVLVNCAGTTQFIPFERMEEVSAETWERLFRVNVTGAFQCARAAAPALRKSDNGQIINISSVAAQLGQGSSIPYCCTKAALDNLTVSLARTLAPEIRVNGIAPGFIAGRWTEKGLGVSYDQVCKAYEQSLPLRKVCQPADIAEAIVSLITGSRLVTGQTLTVDAGMMIAGYQVSYDDALQQANAADPANRR